MPSNLRGKRGFTLIEIVVATSLLAIALLTTSFSLLNLQQLGEASKERVVAVADANRLLEAMREQANASFTTLTNTNWANWFQANVVNTRGANEVVLNQEAVTVNFAGTNPVQATLTVNWNHRQRPQAYQVITQLTDRT